MASEGYLTTDDDVRLYYTTVGDEGPTLIVPNGVVYARDFERPAEGRTVVFYDVRNRGRSETVSDPSKLERGSHHDVDDLDAVRRHFGLETIHLLGHSYLGLAAVLYTMTHSARCRRPAVGSIRRSSRAPTRPSPT